MTMFPANMPEMPPEMVDPIMESPQDFADAMGSGMEAFTAIMEAGGNMEAAFEAFGDVAGPMMGDMGIPPEIFDAVGDMVGAAVGPAMMMGPADAGGGDMGAVMADAVEMMMPEGVPMPPEVGGAMMDMGAAMGDAGVMPHDVASEMMPSPGEPGGMPVDAGGDPLMVPGDPGSVPMMDMNGDPILQAPPADGAMADMGTMMPPPGGYDHAEMVPEFVMPPPFDMATATNVSQGLNPDGSSPEPITGEPGFVEAVPVDLGDALGVAPALGEEGFVGADPAADDGSAAADAAVANALDSAMDQGGGGAVPVDDGSAAADAAVANAFDDTPVDDGSSAGG
jgi:hypothetical protein